MKPDGTLLSDVKFKKPVDIPEYTKEDYVYCDVIGDEFVIWVKGQIITTPLSNVDWIKIKDKKHES